VTPLAESLSRTLLLMRDEVGAGIGDDILLDALTGMRVALVADAANIGSHGAQSAFVTAALLMARSGHQVFLMAPDIAMAAPQPPLAAGDMVGELTTVGRNLLPAIEFVDGRPDGLVDLSISLGDSPLDVPARRRIWLNAEAWSGAVMREEQARPWDPGLWPFGGLAAGGLGAGEAFKVAMLKLLPHALNPGNTAQRFAHTDEATFRLAPPRSPICRDLGEVDFVSGGAITNAVLYCLARIPAVTARGRIIEPDAADLSNLNRNMLLLRSGNGMPKAEGLCRLLGAGMRFRPVHERFDNALADRLVPLAPAIVIGVDHIPTRWVVQRAAPGWLALGATTHWSAMASFHSSGLGCAHCLHNTDDPADGPIPTTACVSFWAGLLTAAYLARHAAGGALPETEQQMFLSPFRPEAAFPSAVAVRPDCPTCQRPSDGASRGAAA
jgi:hypothetical protein